MAGKLGEEFWVCLFPSRNATGRVCSDCSITDNAGFCPGSLRIRLSHPLKGSFPLKNLKLFHTDVVRQSLRTYVFTVYIKCRGGSPDSCKDA